MNNFLRAMELIEQANKLLMESVMEKEITYNEGEEVRKHVVKAEDRAVKLYNKKGANK